MDKRFYKVISLFIKAMLLFASFYYIIQKLTTTVAFASYHSIAFSPATTFYLFLSLLLMLLNWSLEAKKWQVLIAPYEKVSFFQSLQSILAGVTISIFTPNRVGEFTGRVFFLKQADKLKASVKSIIGSFLQLSITLICGLTGIWLYIKKGSDSTVPLYSVFNQQKKYAFILVIFCVLIVSLAIFRLSFFTKLKHQLKEIFNVKTAELIQVFLLSFNRYLVFTLQYYILLLTMGVAIEPVQAFILIAITFFITSVIPTFALTEIVVRSAVAVYIFGILDPAQPLLIASASLLLWIINLAIPALIGSVFIGKLQFFKTQGWK